MSNSVRSHFGSNKEVHKMSTSRPRDTCDPTEQLAALKDIVGPSGRCFFFYSDARIVKKAPTDAKALAKGAPVLRAIHDVCGGFQVVRSEIMATVRSLYEAFKQDKTWAMKTRSTSTSGLRR